MVRWEWNVVKVALELGSNSSKHAWQRCSLGAAGQAMDGVWTIFFLYCSGMVCRARTRWQNLGLQFVWVQAGVLGRKRLGPWAMLLGQNLRTKWIWVPRCCTRVMMITPTPPLFRAWWLVSLDRPSLRLTLCSFFVRGHEPGDKVG